MDCNYAIIGSTYIGGKKDSLSVLIAIKKGQMSRFIIRTTSLDAMHDIQRDITETLDIEPQQGLIDTPYGKALRDRWSIDNCSINMDIVIGGSTLIFFLN